MVDPIATLSTGLETISLLQKLNSFFKRNFAGIKLWIKNPLITLKISEIIISDKRISSEKLIKLINDRLSKYKFNFKDETKDEISFSFLQEETTYRIGIRPKISHLLEENGTVIEYETSNFLNIPYRSKRKLDILLESFFKVCSDLSLISMQKNHEEIIINLSVGYKIKENKQIRTYFIGESKITSKGKDIMISTKLIPNIRDIIYRAIKDWLTNVMH